MDIPFIDIAWFYLVKLFLFAIMIYFAGKPFYNRWKSHGDIKVKKKTPYVLIVLILIMIFINPIKIDNRTESERVRATYDPIAREVKEIELQPKERYSAPDNKAEIQRILNQPVGENQ